eukprot:9123352-Alexandrium_andersonii.AAC.1
MPSASPAAGGAGPQRGCLPPSARATGCRVLRAARLSPPCRSPRLSPSLRTPGGRARATCCSRQGPAQ